MCVFQEACSVWEDRGVPGCLRQRRHRRGKWDDQGGAGYKQWGQNFQRRHGQLFQRWWNHSTAPGATIISVTFCFLWFKRLSTTCQWISLHLFLVSWAFFWSSVPKTQGVSENGKDCDCRCVCNNQLDTLMPRLIITTGKPSLAFKQYKITLNIGV